MTRIGCRSYSVAQNLIYLLVNLSVFFSFSLLPPVPGNRYSNEDVFSMELPGSLFPASENTKGD